MQVEEEFLPLTISEVPQEAIHLLCDVRIPVPVPYRKRTFDIVNCRMAEGTVRGYRIALMKRDELPQGVLFAFLKKPDTCLVIVEDIEFDGATDAY